jgi:peptidoglycan/LPS O-acetylase OafA/YrhL
MQRLLALDFYRSLAIGLVVLYHFYVLVPLSQGILGKVWGVPYGHLGVDIFFVLSGFLLTYTILREQEKRTFTLIGYYKKRIARIAPAYYFALLIALIFTPIYLSNTMGLINIASHLLFVHNLVRDFHGAILGVAWTLGVEMQFYLVVPFLVSLFFRDVKRVLLFLALAIGLAWGYKYFLITQFFPRWDFWNQFIYSTQLPGRIDQFAFGMVACYGYLYVQKHKIFSARREVIFHIGWMFSILALIGTVVLHGKNAPVYWNTPLAIMAEPTLLGAVVAVSIFCALFTKGMMQTIMSHNIFVLIARYSYGIYLWHLLIINELRTLALPWPILFLYTIVLSSILAVLSYELIEKPFLQKTRSTEKQVTTLP